ncbi:hypothetical protein ACJ41O_005679 [Fusarium nematophilum]
MAVKFYAVAVGRKTGIFETWNETEAQVIGYSGAKHKSFVLRQDAQDYIDQHAVSQTERVDRLGTRSQADVNGTEPRLNTTEPCLESHNEVSGGKAVKNEGRNCRRNVPMSRRRLKPNKGAITTDDLSEHLKQLEIRVEAVFR